MRNELLQQLVQSNLDRRCFSNAEMQTSWGLCRSQWRALRSSCLACFKTRVYNVTVLSLHSRCLSQALETNAFWEIHSSFCIQCGSTRNLMGCNSAENMHYYLTTHTHTPHLLYLIPATTLRLPLCRMNKLPLLKCRPGSSKSIPIKQWIDFTGQRLGE